MADGFAHLPEVVRHLIDYAKELHLRADGVENSRTSLSLSPTRVPKSADVAALPPDPFRRGAIR
jgi:hypothetical protein